MRVKCLSNSGAFLPKGCLDPPGGFDEETVFHLTEDKEYVVYGMTIHVGYPWYFLCTERFTYYPFWYPAPLFEVADPKISRYWCYSFRSGDSGDPFRMIFAFEAWALDDHYYDRLTDGYEQDVQLFRYYKELMDMEFPDPRVIVFAQALEDEWVMCLECDEAWEANPSDGMVRCPSCRSILRNPLYSE